MPYLTNYPKNQNPAKPISLVLNVRIALLLGFFFGGQGCYGQGAELVKLEGLQQMIQNEKEQIQVVNFRKMGEKEIHKILLLSTLPDCYLILF